MKRRLTWLVLLGTAIVVTALCIGRVRATTADQFMSKTLYMGTFGEIDVFNHFILPGAPPEEQEEHERHKRNIWLSSQRTKGSSDLYIQQNDWGVGGNTGWHTHPGHSLIIVTAGTVTAYEGNDPDCTPHVYTQGMTLVDPGGDHVHIIRNEGTVVAQTIAVQLVPAGQPRRIDADAPGNCPF